MDTNLLIKIVNLEKKFGKKELFKNLNIDIWEGDRIALIAKNGTGKTVLMNIICGLTTLTNGKIIFQNKKKYFANLGIQFQSGTYPLGIRVNDLIWLYEKIYKKSFVQTKLFKELEIEKIFKQNLTSLSFGQMKKFELFLILATGSKNLILDEITAGMDIVNSFKILNILKKYVETKKANVFYISHNHSEIKKICNRIIVLTKKGIVMNKKINEKDSIEKIIEKLFQKL